MRQNAAIPFYSEGAIWTAHCGADVTGCRFVSVVGNDIDDRPVVGHAAARVLGVAAYDAPLGAGVTVYQSPNVMPVTAGAALTAGQEVGSDAQGRAVPATGGVVAGIVLRDVAAGGEAKVKLV